jgi:hypothetical protein
LPFLFMSCVTTCRIASSRRRAYVAGSVAVFAPSATLGVETLSVRTFKQEDSMNSMKKKLGVAGATAVAAALSFPGAVRATEPLDNATPWGATNGTYVESSTNVTHYLGNSQDGHAHWNAGADRQISPTGDLDFAVVQCGKAFSAPLQNNVPKGQVGAVNIDYTQAAGDLDIQAFDPTGIWLGTSQLTGSQESISLGTNGMNSVVLKVYGFNGATGGYKVTVLCQ